MRVAVVGAGISGLVAAYRLRLALGSELELALVERRERIGGTLHTGVLAGGPVDLGAEAFVGRRPEIPALLRELGLADQLVHPSGRRPLIWSGGTAHPMPGGTLMGIPAQADSMTGLVDEATLRRIATEPDRPLHWKPGDDVSVADLVSERFGAQVVSRSVEPLLGGVYAGLANSIGVRSALPGLAAALDAGAASLSEAVSRALPPPSTAPVFGGIRDGYRVLLDALLAAASPELDIDTTAKDLTRTSRGWRLEPVGECDAVILATPAPVTAELLGSPLPEAAAALARIELSSSAVVALALPVDTPLPENSGILVATGESLRAKAFTLSSRKWPHLAERDVAIVRVSFGRFGDDSLLALSDAELIAAATEDLATVTGIAIRPVTAAVQRWRGGLPQYAPGHAELVSTIESAVGATPGLAVAGAYLHGVGVPACAASGTTAAERILAGGEG
ncbi:protoporphyrinogen oxidase [Nocardia macrotermitis]|uniref:Protoporphyrinogen oxidase n=1 Tax=Nocardia macrotermitis TaxID=2585198 RepID=A0A7K0CVL7_9NOCA|nr:protoporphyrinogen oxidase [Nocardia macrotermitis]MQY17560.1 Protoporphyrinogen oxidase [Nocardia macrotermitis]